MFQPRLSCSVSFLLFSLSLGGQVFAQSAGSYISYTADINGDGLPDIFVKALPKIIFIPIDDDFDVPIPLASAISSFVLLSAGLGSFAIHTDLGDIISSPLWTRTGVSVVVSTALDQSAPSVTINYSGPNQNAFINGVTYFKDGKPCNSEQCPSSNFSVNVIAQGSTKSSLVYEYDAMGRLIRTRRNGLTSASYSYDKVGNRTSKEE